MTSEERREQEPFAAADASLTQNAEGKERHDRSRSPSQKGKAPTTPQAASPLTLPPGDALPEGQVDPVVTNVAQQFELAVHHLGETTRILQAATTGSMRNEEMIQSVQSLAAGVNYFASVTKASNSSINEMSKQLRWALVAPKIPIHQQLDSISSSLSTIANNSQNLLKLGKQQLDCGITQLQNLQELNIKLVTLTSVMEKVAAQKVQPIPTQPLPPPGVPPTMPGPASPQLMGKFFCYLGPIPSSMEPNVMENPPGPGYNPVPTLKSNSLTVWDTQYHKMRSVSPTAFNEERLKAVNQAWAPQGFMQVDGRGLHRIYKDLEGGSS